MRRTDSRWAKGSATAPLAVALAIALAVAASAAACGNPAPTPDPTRVLHLENRTGTAVMVDITSPDPPDYNTAVRPCGGKLDLTAGVDGFAASEWRIRLTTDPSGAFDSALAEWTADPHDMPGSFSGIQILWSRGDIGTSDLPRWITVTSTDVLLSATPPQPNAGATCGPIVSPTNPPGESDMPSPSQAPDASDTTPTDPPNADDTPGPSEAP